MRTMRHTLAATGISLAFIILLIANGCKHEPGVVPYSGSGYPTAVAKIMVAKCAVDGCHNSQSYQNSAGILLDTWDHLFDGSTHGAVVIPYDVENSSLLYFINTDSSLGPVQQPTMPEGGAPLTREEYITIRDWIAVGASDINGKIPFSDAPETRQKIYMTAQGCDLVHVIDAERNVIMRNIKVGTRPTIDIPHYIQVSKDGQYAYVCHIAGDYVQKIDTRNDAVVGQVLLNTGNATSPPSWNTLHISDDGKKGVVVDFSNGILKFFDTEHMVVTDSISGSNLFRNPYGIASNAAFDTFYITEQYGNIVHKVGPSGYYRKIAIDGGVQNYTPNTLDPHEILLTPDGNTYFVTCEASNEVRVINAHTNQLVKVFPTKLKPQAMALSVDNEYVLVTCTEAKQVDAARRGAIMVINYKSLIEIAESPIYGDFFQPYGIAVDKAGKRIYVSSLNADPAGPKPHHLSPCARSNGWYSIYDLTTLKPINNIRYETSVQPASADSRFK